MENRLAAALVALALTTPSAPQEPKAEPLESRLEAVRAEAELPALGAALVTKDGLEGVWVTGRRRAGGEEAVTAEDLWHVGSCTKAMTATLVALLVERGDLDWETALGDLLPELAEEMQPAFREVTLVELLSHRAGLIANPPMLAVLPLGARGEPMIEQRAAYARLALATPPVHEPRESFLYSNAGFVVAGHVAEVRTGRAWEELMRELLFGPLGMQSAGFGPPGTPEVCDQPRGHAAGGGAIEPSPRADNPAVLGPAGTVHATLADWAKFVALHLEGAKGDRRVGAITLTRETFARLHRPYDGADTGYGLGWVVERRPWAGGDGTAIWHNGSNTLWYTVTWLGLENGIAVLVATNQASPGAARALDGVAAMLLVEATRGRGARR